MNRLLFFASELRAGQVALGEGQAIHLRDILKVVPGQKLKAGIINGNRGWLEPGELLAGAPARFEADPDDPGPEPPVLDVVLALPRPQTLRKVLLAAAQLGVGRLFLIRSARVEKSFFHSPLLKDGEWRRHLLAGMEQAGDCRMPRVEVHSTFRPFVEDRLPGLAAGSRNAVVHPGGPLMSCRDAAGHSASRWCLAIGPEGGWQAHEVELFQAAGFEVLGLGPRILRVETALPVLAGQVSLLVQGARVDSSKENR